MKVNKEGKRKLMASIANILLFISIFVVLFPLSMPNVSAGDGDIIYVDDDAPDGGDGSESSPFNEIQEAVTHAAEEHGGDVRILVYAGTYEEKVEIKVPVSWNTLTLEGNHSCNTTVQPPPDSPGTVISISTSWVNVTGFTIKNGSPYGILIQGDDVNVSENNVLNNDCGIYIEIDTDNNSIMNNFVDSNGYNGIWVRGQKNTVDNNTVTYNAEEGSYTAGIYVAGSYNIITNNTCTNNSISGIRVDGSNHDILHNNITNSTKGIILSGSTCKDNTLFDNTISNNDNGIWSLGGHTGSNHNTIKENTITYNKYGIYMAGDITNYNHNETFIGNHIENNTDVGLHVENVKDFKITGNHFNYNGNESTLANGLEIISSSGFLINNSYFINNTACGLSLSSSDENTIKYNYFRLNQDGIYLNGSLGSQRNNIENNNISNNSEAGLELSKSNNNTITNNTIFFNMEYGISLMDSKLNYLHNNTVNNNTVFGLYIEGDYRNNITENNTFNGGNITYIYGINGTPAQLNDTVQNRNLTSGKNVTNVGKISLVECSYFYIAHNKISNATKAIFLYNSNNITFHNNTIYQIDEYGLYIEVDYRHNITTNNTVEGEPIYYYYDFHGSEDNLEPICDLNLTQANVSNVGKITVVDCSYLLLKNNNVSNNDYGIFLHGSKEITMWDNNMSSPKLAGLFVEEGFHHNISQNNTVNDQQIYYFIDIHGTEGNPIINESFLIYCSNVSNVGLITYVNCSYMEIKNNALRFNYGSGIFIVDSFNITVKDNYANNSCDGMVLRSSTNVTVTGNTFIGNNIQGYGKESGIHLMYNKVANYITGNYYSQNNNGVYVESSQNDIIAYHNQTFSSNKQRAIYLDHSSPRIHNNTLTRPMIIIDGEYSHPVIDGNTFKRSGDGIAIYRLSYCNNSARIINNTFEGFGLAAIYLMKSSSPDIRHNEIKDIKWDGIDIYHEDSAPYVYNNTIYDVGYMGIQLEDSNATIINNTIHDVSEGINVNYNPNVEQSLLPFTGSNVWIENNTIWNANRLPPQKPDGTRPSTRNAGIHFTSYSIGVILNNTISNCTYPKSWRGYGLRVSDGATPSEISGNNCSYCDSGMVIIGSQEYLTVDNNTAIGNSGNGINFQGASSSVIVENNNVSDNLCGISVLNGDCEIRFNTIISNDYGMYVVGSDGGCSSPIINNNFINWSGLYGIYAEDSAPTVEWNTFRNKEYRTGGIASYFYNCKDTTAIKNNTYNNSHRGVYLMYTPALVRDNTISLVEGFTSGPYRDDTVGIAVYHQSDASVIYNTISGGDRGIGIEYGSNAIVDINTITDSNYYGIFARNLTGTTIKNNYVNDSKFGVYLRYSSGVNITDNNFTENGIFIEGNLLEHWNAHSINNSNKVNSKPVYYWKNQTGGVIPSGAGQVILANCANVGIENQDLNNCSVGVEIGYSLNITITGNNASNSYYALYLYSSCGSNITNNNMTGNGIFIKGDLIEHWNTHNINISNTVNLKPVYYWKNQTGGTIPPGAGEVILANCTNVQIQSQELTCGSVGIELGFSSNNDIIDNNASNDIYGLYLFNSYENNITGTTVSNDDFGILLYNASSNKIVTNDVALNTHSGIEIHNSEGNNITCNITSNEIYGVYLSNSDENNLIDNYVVSNYYGLYLSHSNGNNITGNNISSNNKEGLYLSYCCNNDITQNFAYNDTSGLYLVNSDENNITGNNATSNSYGIHLYNSDENIITDNEAFSNNLYGIYLAYSSGNNIMQNNASNNTNGLHLSNSDKNIITCNNATSNSYGIYLYDSNESIVTSNIASSNNLCGIYIACSNEVNITHNYAFDNINGLHLSNSDENNITGNNATSNSYGIYLDNSNENIVTNNTASSNNQHGISVAFSSGNKIGMNNLSHNNRSIYLSSSGYNMITNNDIFNNTNQGIYLCGSDNNSIIDNDLYYNSAGIKVNETSSGNLIYHNNLNNTNTNALDWGLNNLWDNGLEGNWWSNNTNLTDSDGDGICDENYTGASFVDNYPLANEDNDRVLVDDPWFWFVQSAVNFAQNGDLIYAKSDTYLESVIIEKTLTVIGENRSTTIIDGRYSQNVIFIYNTTNVKFSGFTVKNGSIGINCTDSEYITIQNNNISWSNNYGIFAKDSSIIVEWNTFRSKEEATGGISSYFSSCTNSTKITNNTYINSLKAVYLMYTPALARDNEISLVTGDSDKDDSVGVAVYHESNASVINNNISEGDSGIRVEYDSNATIIGNNIYNASYYGIFTRNLNGSLFSDNEVNSSNVGVRLYNSTYVTLTNNNVSSSSSYSISLNNSRSNLVYHNNFVSDVTQAYDDSNNGNYWDNGYPSGGNYWSDYAGSDNFGGANQDIPGSDGIGDTPYVIDADSQDNYPLMEPVINGRVQRPPFRINSNFDFIILGFNGLGTQSDPWIIENYDINGAGYGYCIYIGNTTDYFVVRDSYLHEASGVDSGYYFGDSGLILYEVENGTITDNIISSNNNEGICMNESENNTINKNALISNGRGMFFYSSCNNTISNNTIISSDDEGIVMISNSDYNNVISNNISDNYCGLYIDSSSNIIAEINTISYNNDGIMVYNSSPIIRYNNISYNNHHGIGDLHYSNAIIGNNTITHNNGTGIANMVCSNATIDNNTISYNNLGIFCELSSPTITYNNITFNSYGINCTDGSNATIHWNNIHNNTYTNLNNTDLNINISAINNWWGSAPPDTSKIEGEVTYDPWETAPIEEAGPE